MDSLAWPILGGSTTIGNVFYDNYADIGKDLYKNFSADSYVWDQIYAHHNYFEECPPDSIDVYPLSAWDLEHCHSIDLVKNDPIIELGSFHLSPNFPNPFNPITTIPISISYPGFINLTIHDLKGTLVDQWNTFLEIGNHAFVWDAQKLPSGIYFIKVESKQSYDTQKAILLK